MSKQNSYVAAYCRVAYYDDLALEQQKKDLQRYAAQNGYLKPMFYLDNGKSGSNLDRPAFSQMTADIVTGQVNAVLVRDIARIGRNICDVVEWTKQLDNLGVSLITIK